MKIQTYSWDDIQKVYQRFNEKASSVVYSIDGGYTWQSTEMDTGKWGSGLDPEVRAKMLFAFLEIDRKIITIDFSTCKNWDECMKLMDDQPDYKTDYDNWLKYWKDSGLIDEKQFI